MKITIKVSDFRKMLRGVISYQLCVLYVFFFLQFMRVELGVGIQQMKLLGDEEFFCQTEKEIRIYNLNQVC